MKKPFQSILSAGRTRRRRARRSRAVCFAIWLLRLVRDSENTELRRHMDMLDKIDFEASSASRREHDAIEDDCTECEHAIGYLDCAIDDLDFAYEERF
ncbi:MAG: hypothetical protein FWE20_12160 [Defluviitaleaceae bacterium]|nr:hypothetical protein [Defluviitaleaceae bacterium]